MIGSSQGYAMTMMDDLRVGHDQIVAGGRRVGRHVPLWDFDGPIEDSQNPLRDTSAGVIAANGMLVLSYVLAGRGEHQLSARYLESSLTIVQDVLDFALAQEKAHLAVSGHGELACEDSIAGERFDSILKHSTVCNNAATSFCDDDALCASIEQRRLR